MKKQSILNLIKFHVDKNEEAFRDEAYNIALEFSKSGDDQLANYIVTTLAGPIASLSTQDYTNNDYFNNVSLSMPHIYLPNVILNDLQGVINAIKKSNGLNKFLLVGKPGTGKTESAKFIAKALKKELLSINFNRLIDSKLGQSGKNIEELFENINEMAKYNKYIFLFDELDVIALDRIDSRDIREMGRVTSLFLKELDTVNPNAIILATTNLYEKLDRALTRRFDAIINFDRYTLDDLKDIVQEVTKDFANQFGIELSNLSILKKFLDGVKEPLTPGELKNLIRRNLAFSDTKKGNDFYQRMFNSLLPNEDYKDIEYLRSLGLTFREIELLSGVSKSTAARLLQGAINE